ncbi:MAG: alpha/beta hydrolase [Hyphomicrobiales bacterium]|nr:alpha/beta hydrolase [Hyphomicrobiales bacterium]
MVDLLLTGSADAEVRFILAHGAGAGMDSPFMVAVAERLAERGVGVVRFEFAYMAARRAGGKRRPPPAAATLLDEYRAVIAAAGQGPPLIIGGKSMGGRVASMIADDEFTAGRVAGLACLGYPFHPPDKPENLRTAHLETLRCPALIVQGERDPFGSRAEVEAMTLSPQIGFAWMPDGDHDLGPRGASGYTRKGNLDAAADAIVGFARSLRLDGRAAGA